MSQSRDPQAPDLVGQTLGDVTLLKKIGEGSMGSVYRGFQTNLSRAVAVKVVFRTRFDRLFTAERFRQEAEVAANLDHTNIVSIYEFGERSDLLYFVMQLVDGISLSQWLRARKGHPLPRKRRATWEELRLFSGQVLEAMAFAHGEGIVHRDIKPENLMWIERARKVMVTDFGLASAYNSMHRMEKSYVLGSPLYVSPEQARGEEVDGRADLFSFGCVLLEFTLGYLPVKVERPEKIFQTRAREAPDMFTGMARDHMPAVPAAWSDFVARALRPRREERYPDARTMLEALASIQDGMSDW